MRRPLERAVLTSCVGEVLRRHANVEFVYKVQTTSNESVFAAGDPFRKPQEVSNGEHSAPSFRGDVTHIYLYSYFFLRVPPHLPILD